MEIISDTIKNHTQQDDFIQSIGTTCWCETLGVTFSVGNPEEKEFNINKITKKEINDINEEPSLLPI